ncbi:MAG: hypothetical protein U5O39_06170 [Gammaproteobacteria bacterium]|nr:hypothetical protein [Gammaproteobacteria bacterium]
MVVVQGFVIRWVVPITGLRLAGIMGLTFHVVAFVGSAGSLDSLDYRTRR